jgi:hypothetical protein
MIWNNRQAGRTGIFPLPGEAPDRRSGELVGCLASGPVQVRLYSRMTANQACTSGSVSARCPEPGDNPLYHPVNVGARRYHPRAWQVIRTAARTRLADRARAGTAVLAAELLGRVRTSST